MILQFIIEMPVVMHYALAVVFISPNTMFLVELIKGYHVDSDLMIKASEQTLPLAASQASLANCCYTTEVAEKDPTADQKSQTICTAKINQNYITL